MGPLIIVDCQQAYSGASCTHSLDLRSLKARLVPCAQNALIPFHEILLNFWAFMWYGCCEWAMWVYAK